MGLLVSPLLALAGSIAVTAALLGHLSWLVGAMRTRKRGALDWPLRMVLAGATLSAPAAALGVLLAADIVSGPRWALAYAVLALGGWVSLTIAGMMLRIVPFLVWYRAYAARVGAEPVPALAQLGWPAAEAAAFVGLTGGVLTLAGAVCGWVTRSPFAPRACCWPPARSRSALRSRACCNTCVTRG